MTAYLAALDAWCQERDLAPRTRQHYGAIAADYLRWWQEARPGRAPTEATAADVREYLEHVRTAHARPGLAASAATVNQHLAGVRALYEALMAAGVAAANPAARIRGIRQAPPRPKWLTDEERERLLAAAERAHPRDRAAVLLMLLAGLRRSEALALTWGDVGQGAILVRRGKGRKERKVPLARPLAAALAAWRHHREREGKGTGPQAPVLPISPATLARILARMARAAGIRRMTPHMLRHTFCHGLAAAGVRLDQVAALAGHASLETTRLYTLPSDQELAEALAALVR